MPLGSLLLLLTCSYLSLTHPASEVNFDVAWHQLLSLSTSSHALHDFLVLTLPSEVLLITFDPPPVHTASYSSKSGSIFLASNPRAHPNPTAALSVPSSSPGHPSLGPHPICAFRRPWAGIFVVYEEEVNSIPRTWQWRPGGIWFLGPRIWMRQTQYLHNELLATTRNADSSKMRCCGCTWTYQGHRCPSEHILPQQACLCCREFTTSPRLAPSSRKHVVFKTTPSCTHCHI